MVLIPASSLGKLQNFFETSPIMQICRATISDRILYNGFIFKKHDKPFVPTAIVLDTINVFWMDFCRDALDSIMVSGIVCFIVRKKHNQRIPSVLKPGTYDIEVSEVGGTMKFKATSIYKVSSIVVLHSFGYAPSIQGKINSLVNRVFPLCRYADSLQCIALQLERRRLYPQFFAEVTESRSKVEGIDFDFYSTNNGDTERFDRNESLVADLKNQTALYTSLRSGQNNHTTTTQEVKVLPAGQKIVPIAATPGRSDLGTLIRMTMDTVCCVFGVPRHVLIRDHGKNKLWYNKCVKHLLNGKFYFSFLFFGFFGYRWSRPRQRNT
jgi:hypothetical protein